MPQLYTLRDLMETRYQLNSQLLILELESLTVINIERTIVQEILDLRQEIAVIETLIKLIL